MRYFVHDFMISIKTFVVACIMGFCLMGPLPSFCASGKYLVAVQAAGKNDFDKAAKTYLSLLEYDFFDSSIMREALVFSVLANKIESAQELSRIAEQHGLKIPSAGLISLIGLYDTNEYDKVTPLLLHYENLLPAFLLVLANGWTEIANGSLEKGIETFGSLDGSSRYLGLYNSAIAFAMAGDFQNAIPFLRKLEGQKLAFDEIQLQALAQIYSQNNENEKAIKLLKARDQKENLQIFDRSLLDLENGKTLKFNAFNTPSDALANVFYLMGNLDENINKNPIGSIFYMQLAEFLSSDKDYYQMRVAEILAGMELFSYSIEKFNQVDRANIFYLRAQLGIADTLVRDGQYKLAQNVLEQLIKDGFDEFIIFDSLADIFRTNEDYDKAIYYYDTALDSITENAKSTKWSTFFVRGISYDQSGNWDLAKMDLENALQLSSNHPEVLNYLGYSLIERNEDLDKALAMIEKAVTQRPDSGYIIDSLAWGLYRLGQYQEAIVPMERAVELEPHDPIVNDHLGDILWMIGRKREASFQWKRALLFGPTAENEKKIRKKLKYGMTDL